MNEYVDYVIIVAFNCGFLTGIAFTLIIMKLHAYLWSKEQVK